jgi:MtN3 and saliva related transmembrane protein
MLLDITMDNNGMIISVIGVAAAVLTTSSFLPQIIKAYRTKSMKDVSHLLMMFFSSGTVLWMIYGIFKTDLVIITANAVATGLNVVILALKFHYARKENVGALSSSSSSDRVSPSRLQKEE